MSDENLSQIEILDHKQLMEKIRILCDKIDELFLIYDQLQLAVPDHNANRDAHRDIRELIIALDDREGDHYSELNNTITTNNDAVNARIDNLRTSVETTTDALANRVDHLDDVTTAVTSGTVTYTNPLVTEVRTQTYLNGNTGTAALNSTAPAGYNVMIKAKSTHGVFTEGTYNNKYQISYTSDETIAANANRLDKTNVLIDENGDAHFSNNVTIDGTIVADNITGHVTNKVDTAAAADTAILADKAKSLVSDDTFNTTDTHLLKYSSGQFSGIAGSSNDLTALSYPNGATIVNSSNKANIQNIRLLWAGNSKYWHDFFVSPNQRYVWHRDVQNGTANAWARIVEESTDTTWGINISGSAANATHAAEATHAVSADTALQATNAANADKARLATDATHAVNADNAVNAANATYAANAGTATSATSATTATNATRATNDDQGNPLRSYYVNTATTQTVAGNKTFTGVLTANNGITVLTQDPVITNKSSVLTKGTKPSVNLTLGNKFVDKNNQTMSSATYQASNDGASKLILECANLDGSSAAQIALGFDTKSATLAMLYINAEQIIPNRPGSAILGNTAYKFRGIFTDGLTITNDGVGIVKLLAREYTSNSTTSAYANIAGSSLYAVSFRTSAVTTSGSLVFATPTLIIDKSSSQPGTWAPVQYQSGSWRSDGNYIIGLYRRIL